MGIPEFLSALQAAKKELLRPERLDLESRLKAASAMANVLETDSILRSMDPSAKYFSEDFYRNEILEKSARAFQAASTGPGASGEAAFPVGLLSMRIESPFFLRLFCERAAAALIAGNNLIAMILPAQKTLAETLCSLLQTAGFPPESLQLLVDDADSKPLLLQHPGIRGVTWFDPALKAQDLGSETWFDKKWQLHRGGKSTAIVLADADLDQAVEGILRAVIEGQGTLSWNVSRVIVLDSLEKAFLEKLGTALQSKTVQLADSVQKNRDNWVVKFKSQQARELVPDHPLAFLVNVSNCSEEHQVELGAPVVFIMTVKYPHEMQKWINSLPNSLGVQAWGSDEKIQKIAHKLETGRLWVRGWIEQDEDLFYGVKSSVFGSWDGRAFGAFYSEHRKSVTEAPKNHH